LQLGTDSYVSALPKWLPDITMLGLRLGQQIFDIRFRRDETETAFEVLRGDASAIVREIEATRTLGAASR